jgi:hypothetical protein
MMTENLRREARVEVRVPVVLLRGKTAVAVETSDVSFKGLFVCVPEATGQPPALRSLVRLKVALHDREFEAHAMVVHVSNGASPGVGLQFWGLAGPDRTAWDNFVRGLVHARRTPVKQNAKLHESPHPAMTEPMTPSGIRILVMPTPRASVK